MAAGRASGDKAYRPDPERAVWIRGEIRLESLENLIPSLLRFRHVHPKEPITLYIDSPGGIVDVALQVFEAAKTPDQDDFSPKLITVGMGTVASAAAVLLISGDYAIAYPQSRIVCHGTRIFDFEVTRQSAEAIARLLDRRNLSLANRLAAKIFFRHQFLLTIFREQIERNAKDSVPADRDLYASNLLSVEFLKFMRDRCSSACSSLFDATRRKLNLATQYLRHEAQFSESQLELPAGKRDIHKLKYILEKELDRDDRNWDTWDFLNDGLHRIEEEFRILKFFDDRFSNELIREIPDRLLGLYMAEENARLVRRALHRGQPIPNEVVTKAQPVFFSFWLVASFLARELLEEEYDFSAADAFWLGLIDEVIGLESFPSERRLIEGAVSFPRKTGARKRVGKKARRSAT
ncbi:MAG: ATP-dependent Clp protease proteolytic subunit [Verrucomicrobiae bacterium]|nr:ATP-dependent Clp protease proteolytic subunit [Verrucomicrobiae bacterium]